MTKNPLSDLGHLGDYVRQQREAARLSVRQLAELAGVSNPYLSQIERGLKRPSADILQQLAKALQLSAETLYVQAGILPERPETSPRSTVRAAIEADPDLTIRQRAALLDIYASFVAGNGASTMTEPARATAPVEPAGS
ncbi:MAG: helix-turn-helix domain-containing protein [Nostocoides sp.]